MKLLRDTAPLLTSSVTIESTSASTHSVGMESDTTNEHGGDSCDSVSLNSDSAIIAMAHAADPADASAAQHDNMRAGHYNDAASAAPNRSTVRCHEYVEGVARPANSGYTGLRGENINDEYVAP